MKIQLQLDIYKGVPREMASIKCKRSMKLFLKDMVELKRDSHTLKEKCRHGNQMLKDITRAPMYGKALPFT